MIRDEITIKILTAMPPKRSSRGAHDDDDDDDDEIVTGTSAAKRVKTEKPGKAKATSVRLKKRCNI